MPATRQPIPVGKYFLDRGKITAQQLDVALQHRQEFGLKLGQSLVELGLVTEADMVEALRHQARFPCIHLTPGIVDEHVARELGEQESRRLRAVAMNRIASHATVALEDPDDVQAIEELARQLDSKVFPVYAEPSAITAIIEQLFGSTGTPVKVERREPRSATAAGRPAVRPPAPPASAARPSTPGPAPAPDEKAVVERVRAILQEAFAHGVSDIHLEARRADLRVRFRLDGTLSEHATLPASWTRPTIACLRSLAGLEDAEGSAPSAGTIPFLFKKQPFEVRVATTRSLHGECAVLHVQEKERPPQVLEELGLGAEQRATLEELLAEREGLVLVSGPAASGKSTTLHALLAQLVDPQRKVVALEGRGTAPAIEGVLQVQVDPELGLAASLHALMEQDPDILLVEAIEDAPSARAALEAARAGCLVLAGLQASSVRAALKRLVALGLEPDLLAETLRGVVAQRLARRICPDCKLTIVPDARLVQRLGLAADGATYSEGKGCDSCRGTGGQGRVALFEVVRATDEVLQRLERGAEGRTPAPSSEPSLRDHGLALARAGTITLQEMLAATSGS